MHVRESLGFSPFELEFGNTERGLLKVVKEGCLKDTKWYNLLDCVRALKYRLYKACTAAKYVN